MQPRKSSAFSSEPDAAEPLARTDLAICLKYLLIASKMQPKASHHGFVFYYQKSLTWTEMKTVLLGGLPAHSAKSTDFVELLAGLGHGHVVIMVPAEKHQLSTDLSSVSDVSLQTLGPLSSPDVQMQEVVVDIIDLAVAGGRGRGGGGRKP